MPSKVEEPNPAFGDPSSEGNEEVVEVCSSIEAEGWIYTPAIRLGFARRAVNEWRRDLYPERSRGVDYANWCFRLGFARRTVFERSRRAHPVTLRVPPLSMRGIS